jgi:cation diffusion facilitator CzcD-associated flavoprotein CzcO
MYEHPDFPMDEQKFGVKPGQHIPAEKMLEYIMAFTEESGVSAYIRLNTKVDIVEKLEEGWKLHCASSVSKKKYEITTPKLIVAVGNTNEPKMPRFQISPAFEPTILHSKDFPAQYSKVVQPDTHTLVVGCGKSAWDVAYACATQSNATATLLMRPSGNGPVWMSPSHVTPFTLWLEKLVFTRFVGCKSSLYILQYMY